jgi:hypothetical protein
MVGGSIVGNLEGDIVFRLVQTVGGLQFAIESINPRHSKHSTNGLNTTALSAWYSTIALA